MSSNPKAAALPRSAYAAMFGPIVGDRLDIAPGTAARFEPGSTREVTLVRPSGGRAVYGFRGDVMRPL